MAANSDVSSDEQDDNEESKKKPSNLRARFGDNPDISSDDQDDEELSGEEEMELDDEEEEEPMRKAPLQKPQRQVRKDQRFKLVGLDSSRDFQSFAPGDEYEQDVTRQTAGTMGERRKQLEKLNEGIVVEDAPFGGKSATFSIKGLSFF